MRKRTFGLVVAFAAVAAAAVVFWPRGGSAPRPSETAGGGAATEGVPAGAPGEAPAPRAGPGLAAGTGPVTRERVPAARKGRSTIEGVVRRDGKPCAAKVELRAGESEEGEWSGGKAAEYIERVGTVPVVPTPVATASAGADGRYEFKGWAKGGYVVRAVAADGASGRAEASVPVDGARVEANVDLSAPGGPLAGRVVHADGKPWTGTVAVAAAGEWFNSSTSDAEAVAATDADGRFSVEGLAAGTWRVVAILPGVAFVSGEDVTLPQKGEYVLTVDGSLRRVEGRVLDDASAEGVAGAAVAAWTSADKGVAGGARGTSGGDGGFRLDVPGSQKSEAWLLVAADGYAPERLQSKDPAKPIEVRLKKGAAIDGRVLSAADATPIANANVTANGGRFWERHGSATSGSDGRYAISGLPVGEAWVGATAPGWIAESASTGELQGATCTLDAGKTVTVDIRMVRSARAGGRVLDEKGTPVPGAVVSAESAGDSNSPFAGMAWRFRSGDEGPSAASGADGAFSIDGLVPGSAYRFRASAPGFCEVQSAERKASAETPIEVEIRFAPSREIDVTVLDEATGAPIEAAEVSAAKPSEGMWDFANEGERDGKTGSDGHVRLGSLPAGALHVQAEAPDYVSRSEIPVAEREAAVTVRLKRGLAISGRVLGPDGSPATGAHIYVGGGTLRTWMRPSARCEADGTFRLTGLADGKCSLHASATIDGREASAKTDVAAGAEGVVLELKLDDAAKGGRILVRVLDPEGKPVGAAQVKAETSRRSSTMGLGGDGRATISVDGEAAVYAIEVSGACSGSARFGPARVEGIKPGPEEVVIRLPPEMTISGLVLDPAGGPVAGAVVRASPGEPGAGGGHDYRDEMEDSLPFAFGWSGDTPFRTGPDGAFTVGGLGPGPHALRVKPPGDYVKPEPVRAVAGDTGVRIVLRKGAGVVVHVVGPDGKPVKGAHVATRKPGESGEDAPMVSSGRRFFVPWTRVTDADGNLKLVGLDPASECVLDVTPPESRGDLLARTIDRWTPHDDTVRLEAGWMLKGVVKDGAGSPVPRARVQWRGPDGKWTWGESTNEEGRFTIHDLPLSSVVLRAHVGAEPPDRAAGPEVTASPGTAEVVIVIDAGASLTVVVDGWPRDSQGHVSLSFSGGSDSTWVSGGRATFRGLDAGATYAVFAKPEGCDQYGLREGVHPSAEPVHVGLVTGNTIRVRVKAPAGAGDVYIYAAARSVFVSAERSTDGCWEIPGLPDGTWHVSASAEVGKDRWEAAADVAAGGSADLELKPPER